MNARTLIVGAVVIGLSVWAGFWFYNNFKWVDEKVDIGYQGEAKTNSFLAAQRLIVALGGTAQPVRGMPNIPPQGTTLVMPTLRNSLGPKSIGTLLSWVAAGNHLVVATHGEYYTEDKKDVLLDALGISEINAKAKGDYKVKHINAEIYKVPTVDMSGNGELFQVDFDALHRLTSKQAALWKIEDNAGAYLVRVKHGNGRVTVMSDYGFMENDAIGKYDHAAFMARVLDVHPDGAVWLVYSEDMPSLPQWLATHAWQALISGALLLMVWLWAASRRFGVLLPEPVMERRSLLEHITAGGHFLWRHGGESALLMRVRASVKQAIFLRYPRWVKMPDEQFYRELSLLSGLSTQQIQKALDLPVYGNQHEFTSVIKNMEIIRRKL